MTDVFIVTLGDRLLLAQLPRYEPLRDKLERAIVVSSEAVPADVVTMNSRVRYVDGNGEHVAALVYPAAAGGPGALSIFSASGAALLGLCEGQETECVLIDGSLQRMRVDEVLHQPERAMRPGR
ncbi:MAG TPA: nucleoside diphosphate kinase regulator [Burkholderiales bacterium]|nr:nucleoside diphosphate kinase regulator [Burkholderiales bacterium]